MKHLSRLTNNIAENYGQVSEAALDTVANLYPGIDTAASIPDAVSGSNLIVYAVKPQNCAKVHAEIRRAKSDGGTVRDDAVILSVVAGKPVSDFLESGIGRVARSMPNTPARIGAGVTVWSCTDNIDLNERGRIRRVLNSFGQTGESCWTCEMKVLWTGENVSGPPDLTHALVGANSQCLSTTSPSSIVSIPYVFNSKRSSGF